MISPEVWNFKEPQHHFSVEKRGHKKSDVPGIVTTHYFNHSISLVLPDTVSIPDELRTCILEDSDYYRINALNASDLLNKEFIEAFVKKGELSLLTVGNKIDLDNLITITPTGHLLLSLVTEDFQKLGLEGKESFFDRKIRTRYAVTIDLKSDSFTPGKKNYEHTLTALKERLEQTFDVIITWNPPDERLCPSSVAAWFHDHGYEVYVCHQTVKQKTEYSLNVPVISEKTDVGKLFEWLGILSISGDLKNGKEDDYINSYVCPSPFVTVGQLQYLQCTGFFTTKQTARVYEAVKEYLLLRDTLPWAALHVQGFADSPVSWDLKEHMFFTDGDNSYTILFIPNRDIIIRKSLSSNNKPRVCQ